MLQKEEVSAYPGKTEIAQLQPRKEVSFWLDGYDDIFSDFDPRPYSQRSLSDDFLAEARKASRDKDQDKLELRLLVANDKRDPKIEAMIRKRLRDHFSKHANQLRADIRKTRNSST